MDFILVPFQYWMHLDVHLQDFIALHGHDIYLLLFLVIFCETGLVVAPFLPGDSLLFAAGSLAALGDMNIHLLFMILFAAAVIGDNTNYFIGRHFGRRLFRNPNSRIFSKKHLHSAEMFYAKHGPKAIIIARFIPIIRSFTPCVAGIGAMYYPRFLGYDIVGGLLWVGGILYTSYFFGNIPFIKQHFSIVIIAIVFISLIPVLWEVLRNRIPFASMRRKSNRG